jgi:hypothetical protein
VVAARGIYASRQYFTRQAATLLRLAQPSSHLQLAAVLIEKAADLKSQVDEDRMLGPTARALDVEPEWRDE